MVERLLSSAEVLALVPYSLVHIYRLMNDGKFPRAVKCGAWRVAWRESEIEEWIEARPRAVLKADSEEEPTHRPEQPSDPLCAGDLDTWEASPPKRRSTSEDGGNKE